MRDRLLGGVCCDIDVALSSMTGKAFGDALTAFLKANDDRYRSRAGQLGIPYTRSSSFNSTSADEAKSKSLQTAVGMLFGLDIDLVNLRSEVYDDESNRTPSMQFGTAKEDASRRDATVNTLFYNLESQKVEDFTGTGLADLLVNRIIRTPLNPRQTFLDDPLRVLRLVRMSSKLGYPVEDDTFRWMENEEIHMEMDHKVKRERFGIEIGKMVASSHPERGLALILRAKLYTTIFIGRNSELCAILRARLLSVDQQEKVWPTTWSRAIDLLVALLHGTDDLGEFLQASIPLTDMWYLAIYSPVAALRHDHIRQAIQDVTASIKLTRRLSELLERCLKNMDSIDATCDLIAHEPSTPRSLVGMRIRSWGPNWEAQILYALLASEVYEREVPRRHEDSQLARYTRLIGFVKQQGLEKAQSAKPLLDGNEIKSLFGVQKGGKFIKTAIDDLLIFGFDHQDCGKEDAKAWLLSQRESLGVPLTE